jgi:tetratricopeptide (TPR) repeat protein
MAVLIEGFSVVIRNSTLAAKYPDGVEGYRRDCPNATFCADESLSRVGFMVLSDAEVFVAQLVKKGLLPSQKETAEDVAVLSLEQGPLQPCPWIELGRLGQAVIAWQAGTKRGNLHAPSGWNPKRHLQKISADEMKRRLKFIRFEGNIDVYLDKTTGQEVFVGRTAANSGQSNSRHNELYSQGYSLIEDLIILDNHVPSPLDPQHRKRLEDAIPIFIEVLRINPDNWSAMWMLGKVYQRLGDYERALQWFSRAHRIKPDQPDVVREAAIAAMAIGRSSEAIQFCERAIEAKPDDPGLHANLALALLFSEKPTEAKVAAKKAIAQDPADKITAHIVRIIEEVLEGARPCPHHIKDLS